MKSRIQTGCHIRLDKFITFWSQCNEREIRAVFSPRESDSLETIEVIIVKRVTVTALDTRMHQVLIILTLPFIQGHTDLNYDSNKCSITSETVQAVPIKIAVKIVRLKVHITFSQSDDLALHSRSQVRLKLDKRLTCTIVVISRAVFTLYGIQTWHDGRFMHGTSAHARFDTLDLD